MQPACHSLLLQLRSSNAAKSNDGVLLARGCPVNSTRTSTITLSSVKRCRDHRRTGLKKSGGVAMCSLTWLVTLA